LPNPFCDHFLCGARVNQHAALRLELDERVIGGTQLLMKLELLAFETVRRFAATAAGGAL